MTMNRIQFTPDQEQILRAQVIDDDQPGPVLHDFRVILDFVGTKGVKAGGKYHLPPIEAIGDLNQRLSRPLLLNMQRPQLRSHPYLQGLHLLLRASGLGRVEGTGSKARLVLDPAMMAQWQRLNPTEQYFNLLEAWLRFGRPEMVGDRGRDTVLLFPCVSIWMSLPAEERRFDLERPQEAHIPGIYREFYQLALMDLFGFVGVEHPNQPVQPWCPSAVRHVPFGDALLALLAEKVWAGPMSFLIHEDSPESAGFGAWQPLFQPYFPEWRENLQVPKAARRKGTFVFRVALGKAWRRIAVRASDTLDTLVGLILNSVDFDNDHLYTFTYTDRFGKRAQALHPYMDEGPSGDEVHIGDLPLEQGQSMRLVYDFGDHWEFDVKLERIEPPSAKIEAPCILESHGKAPEQYPSWDE
jgi:hypothetical protein